MHLYLPCLWECNCVIGAAFQGIWEHDSVISRLNIQPTASSVYYNFHSVSRRGKWKGPDCRIGINQNSSSRLQCRKGEKMTLLWMGILFIEFSLLNCFISRLWRFIKEIGFIKDTKEKEQAAEGVLLCIIWCYAPEPETTVYSGEPLRLNLNCECIAFFISELGKKSCSLLLKKEVTENHQINWSLLISWEQIKEKYFNSFDIWIILVDFNFHRTRSTIQTITDFCD